MAKNNDKVMKNDSTIAVIHVTTKELWTEERNACILIMCEVLQHQPVPGEHKLYIYLLYLILFYIGTT